MIPKTDPSRLPRLDSVRGIAALMVAAFHTLPLSPAGSWRAHFDFLIDGKTAVAIFFVLSGLVLGMSLHRENGLTLKGYWAFLVRRFFRLYPAYAITTVPYLLFLLFLRARVERGEFIGSGDFNGRFQIFSAVFPSHWQLLENFVFASQYLNGVTWTLKVEAQAAFLLPFLHWLSTFVRWKGWLTLLGALILMSLFSQGSTRIYLYLFYAGYLLPAVLRKFKELRLTRPHLLYRLMLAAVVATFAAAHSFSGVGPERPFGALFAAVGSFILLILLLAGTSFDETIFRPLDYPVFRFLGAISYSFYLIYLICMDPIERLASMLAARHLLPLNDDARQLLVFIAAAGIAAYFGDLSHRYVEKPFIRFGARFYPRREQGLPAAPRLHAAEVQ